MESSTEALERLIMCQEAFYTEILREVCERFNRGEKLEEIGAAAIVAATEIRSGFRDMAEAGHVTVESQVDMAMSTLLNVDWSDADPELLGDVLVDELVELDRGRGAWRSTFGHA